MVGRGGNIIPLPQQYLRFPDLLHDGGRAIRSKRNPYRYLSSLSNPTSRQNIDNDLTSLHDIPGLIIIRCIQSPPGLPHGRLVVLFKLDLGLHARTALQEVGPEIPGLDDDGFDTEGRELFGQSFGDACAGEFGATVDGVAGARDPGSDGAVVRDHLFARGSA